MARTILTLASSTSKLSPASSSSLLRAAVASSSSSSSSSRSSPSAAAIIRRRPLSTSPRVLQTGPSDRNSPFERPGPPSLPREQQKEFDRLIKERGNQLQFKRPDPQSSRQAADSTTGTTSAAAAGSGAGAGATVSSSSSNASRTQSASASAPSISGSDVHPNARKPPPPDFQGDENPLTGEVGGPKKDPLQWEREWTYGGRATDF
ncbi:unnamed protein product [Parajaminaea phylloscopi]